MTGERGWSYVNTLLECKDYGELMSLLQAWSNDPQEGMIAAIHKCGPQVIENLPTFYRDEPAWLMVDILYNECINVAREKARALSTIDRLKRVEYDDQGYANDLFDNYVDLINVSEKHAE